MILTGNQMVYSWNLGIISLAFCPNPNNNNKDLDKTRVKLFPNFTRHHLITHTYTTRPFLQGWVKRCEIRQCALKSPPDRIVTAVGEERKFPDFYIYSWFCFSSCHLSLWCPQIQARSPFLLSTLWHRIAKD